MRDLSSLPYDRFASATSVTNATESEDTIADITVSADGDHFWAIDMIAWSYSADPTNGKLSISFGGTLIFEVDITKGGPGILPIVTPIYTGTPNEALLVELAAGGSGVTGKLNIRYR